MSERKNVLGKTSAGQLFDINRYEWVGRNANGFMFCVTMQDFHLSCRDRAVKSTKLKL